LISEFISSPMGYHSKGDAVATIRLMTQT